MGEVNHRPLIGDGDMPEARLRLGQEKEIGRAVALIFVVVAWRLSGSWWQWLPGLFDQLLARFIKVDLRAPRIIGFGVEIQHLFHPGHKLGADTREAPLFFQPRLEHVFFSTRRTAS